jgi:tetratricopeptide (TPR) repeat protein
MTYLGFSQANDNQEEAAIKTLEGAREAYRSIDGLKLDDLPSAAAFAEATAWQVAALQQLGRDDDADRVGREGAKVAGQVAEKRPGHMGAIRARALISDSLSGSENNRLHLAKAVTLAEAAARDWEDILKIDPTNQIAWNNLANDRLVAGYYLLRMGRLSESLQKWRSAIAIEQQAKPSGMIGRTLTLPAAGVANLEADLGDPQAAEAALVQYARLLAMAVKELPPDSFGRAVQQEFGVFGVGIMARYALPLGARDYPAVRDMALASLRRGDALKPRDPLQEFIRNAGLTTTYGILADAYYNLKDYAAADKAIKEAIDHRRHLPKRTLQDELDANDELMLAAMIAARLGRSSEAQQIIEPVVKFHRRLHTPDHDDLVQHVELARALYVSALAAPGQAAQLTEAAGLIDALPPMMRRQVSIALWRDRIAEEQKARR